MINRLTGHHEILHSWNSNVYYVYMTTNGKIFVKKNEKDQPRIIQSENDYQKLVVELHPTATEENLISK